LTSPRAVPIAARDRGFDLKLDVWGANTQYHLQQMKIALPVLGIGPERFEVVLYQFVRFLHEGVLVRMGRRTGQFLLLEDVLSGWTAHWQIILGPFLVLVVLFAKRGLFGLLPRDDPSHG